MIAVNHFITRLEQGYTEAFLCRATDGALYVAKSKRAGTTALVKEFLCGRIGRELDVQIPHFELLYATNAVANYAINDEMRELAEMPGFGSQFVTDGPAELGLGLPSLNLADIPEIPEDVRFRVLLFDWLVLNFDRIDGNPNLLWEPRKKELHVIDHNLSFGDDGDENFWQHHIFRADGYRLSDPSARLMLWPKLQDIIASLPGIWNELPDEWTEGCILTRDRVDEILRRCEADSFWCMR
jgi:hypothetical protein